MQQRTLSLVGPGRAGTAIAAALVARGWTVVGMAGRDPVRTAAAAERLGAGVVPIDAVARGAALLVVATPDVAVAGAACAAVAGAEPGALVVHLAGAHGVALLDDARAARPDLRFGALHPLQTLAGPTSAPRLVGAFAAVEGPTEVEALAREIGLRPFTVEAGQRTRYHATAAVASNHLVALLGAVERLAAAARVPFDAFLPLVRTTIEAAAEVGPAAALTGPVARGDHATVAAHLAALDPSERPAYLALAREALRLTGRDDPELEAVLG